MSQDLLIIDPVLDDEIDPECIYVVDTEMNVCVGVVVLDPTKISEKDFIRRINEGEFSILHGSQMIPKCLTTAPTR